MVSFRYHGNYVGPGWSAGKYQPSVAESSVPAVDEFDETAKEHDRAYALEDNLKEADYRFYRKNIGRGWKRSIAALAVGAQGFLRKPEYSFLEKKRKMYLPTPSKTPRKLNYDSDVSMRSARSASSSYSGVSRLLKADKKQKKAARRAARKAKKASKKTVSFGASGSSSSGRFKKGTRKLSTLDYFGRKGVVIARERGNVVGGDLANKYQSMIVGHATFNRNYLPLDLSHAIVKTIFSRLKIWIQDYSNLIYNARPLQIDVAYLRFPSDSVQTVTTTTVAGTTKYSDLVSWFSSSVLKLADTHSAIYFQRLSVIEAVSGTVAGTTLLQMDLRRAQFDIYVKSALKLQNRTVNTAGQTEADEVDNVPLYGKSYEGSGNWIGIGNEVIAPLQGTPANEFVGAFLAGHPAQEPLAKSQVKKCSLIGKAHLDPGQIKTSVIVYRKKFTLNSLTRMYLRSTSESGSSLGCIEIGKFRAFHLEKMIQSVGTDNANAIKMAFEVDYKIGIAFTAKRQYVTNYICDQSPL